MGGGKLISYKNIRKIFKKLANILVLCYNI